MRPGQRGSPPPSGPEVAMRAPAREVVASLDASRYHSDQVTLCRYEHQDRRYRYEDVTHPFVFLGRNRR